MLRNFPTRNPIANLFEIISLLFTLAVTIWAFSIGAFETAYFLIGTLIIAGIIYVVLWVGTKLGWSPLIWKIIPALMIIAGVILGIFIYTRSSDQTLAERTFQLEGREINMLIPKNLGYKETVKGDQVIAVFGRKGQDISSVGVSIFETSSPSARSTLELADCSDFKQTMSFTVNVSSLDNNFDICSNQGGPGETELYLQVVVESDIYTVVAIVKDEQLENTNSKDRLKRIFESFSVND